MIAQAASLHFSLGGGNALRRAAAQPRRATLAAPGPPRADLLGADQLQAALSRQLSKSAEAAAVEAARKQKRASTQGASAIPARKEPRRAARAAARAAQAADATVAAARSEAAQAVLRQRAADLDEATLDFALRVQLRQSGTFDETEFFARQSSSSSSSSTAANAHTNSHSAAASSDAPAAAAAATTHTNGHGSGHSTHLFEDGTLIFSATCLSVITLEDALTA